MDDIKTVVKELRRIADAGEKIAKALEKQNKTINLTPNISVEVGESTEEELILWGKTSLDAIPKDKA